MTPRKVDLPTVQHRLAEIDRILTWLEEIGQAPSRGRAWRGLSFFAAADVGLITQDLAASLAPAAGLRNVLVHDYLDTDLEIVASAIPLARVQFEEYRRQVGRWLAETAQDNLE